MSQEDQSERQQEPGELQEATLPGTDTDLRLERALRSLPQLEEPTGMRAAIEHEILRKGMEGADRSSAEGSLRQGAKAAGVKVLPVRSRGWRPLALAAGVLLLAGSAAVVLIRSEQPLPEAVSGAMGAADRPVTDRVDDAATYTDRLVFSDGTSVGIYLALPAAKASASQAAALRVEVGEASARAAEGPIETLIRVPGFALRSTASFSMIDGAGNKPELSDGSETAWTSEVRLKGQAGQFLLRSEGDSSLPAITVVIAIGNESREVTLGAGS